MDLREYERRKFEIADLLRQMELAASDKQKWRGEASTLFARLAEDRFNLVLVGRFSRGKTSLANAILGMDRLPTGVVPLTSVITSVAYGSAERVVLRYARSFMDAEVSLDSLSRHITQQGNPGNVERIREAEVQLPAEFLRRGFHFVDTPGLGSAIKENTRTTESYLPEADAFLLVTSFDAPLSEEEMRFFRLVSSSTRHVFVVLNKQDAVDDRQRTEAVEFVRRQLEAMFGPDAPEVFPLSAREALEAKQTGNSRLLERSGILSLEHELVDFLLMRKRSEFLLRMCDRLSDLARSLPSSERTASLSEAIAELSRRVSDDRLGTSRTSEPHPESLNTAPSGTQLRPCEVCTSAFSALWEFLTRFQNEIAINQKVRGDLAERGGLCSFHTWQYESIASPQGVCEGYPPILEDWAAWMRGTAADANAVGLAAKLAARIPAETNCILCRVRAKAEADAIAALALRFAGSKRQALDGLSSLCLPHFAALAAALKDGRLIAELAQRQAALLDRLAEDLKRSALKHDGARRSLLSDEEETASKRALALLAKARPLADGS
jgi:GTP-binding protein EngB required for normal cell division